MPTSVFPPTPQCMQARDIAQECGQPSPPVFAMAMVDTGTGLRYYEGREPDANQQLAAVQSASSCLTAHMCVASRVMGRIFFELPLTTPSASHVPLPGTLMCPRSSTGPNFISRAWLGHGRGWLHGCLPHVDQLQTSRAWNVAHSVWLVPIVQTTANISTLKTKHRCLITALCWLCVALVVCLLQLIGHRRP